MAVLREYICDVELTLRIHSSSKIRDSKSNLNIIQNEPSTTGEDENEKKKSEEKINEIIPKGIGILEFRTDGWSLFRCVCLHSSLLLAAFILSNFRNPFQTVKTEENYHLMGHVACLP